MNIVFRIHFKLYKWENSTIQQNLEMFQVHQTGQYSHAVFWIEVQLERLNFEKKLFERRNNRPRGSQEGGLHSPHSFPSVL